MTRADLEEADLAIRPLAPSGLLVAFPSLRFPAARTSLLITECAAKLGITPNHLTDLLHEDGVIKMDLTFGAAVSRPNPADPSKPHTPIRKAALRIPVPDWSRFLGRRWFATNGELPPIGSISQANSLEKHPELEPDFGTTVLSLKEVSAAWGCSYQHLCNLWLDPLTRRFSLLDLRSIGSTKAVWRMPVEEYRRATLAALAAGQKFVPTPRDGTPRKAVLPDLPPSRHADRLGQQAIPYAAHG